MRAFWYAAVAVLSMGPAASAGTVTYDFIPAGSGGDAVAAVLVFAAPPASPDSAWSAGDVGDVLEFTLPSVADFTVQSIDAESDTGLRLDDGGVDGEVPGIPVSSTFSAVPGASVLDAGPFGSEAGDWLLQGGAPAPEPAGWLLLAIGAASIGMRRRRPDGVRVGR